MLQYYKTMPICRFKAYMDTAACHKIVQLAQAPELNNINIKIIVSSPETPKNIISVNH